MTNPPSRKALLVGAGGMGQGWAKNLNDCDAVQTVGWVDIRPGTAEAAADRLKLTSIQFFTDLGKALAECKPDFLVDVTIPEAHHDVTLQALAAGVPVLGEKPMADTLDRARAMVTASEKAGLLYMVSQSRRYNDQLHAFRKLIVERTGPIGILNADFFIGAHFGGFRDEMPSPLLLDMAIHTFDAARYVSRADPVSVYCDEFNPAWSWYKGNASATALFEMTGGLRFTYRGSWCGDGHHTSWEGDWRAVGPNGTALWDGKAAPTANIITGREPGHFHLPVDRVAPEVPKTDAGHGIGSSLREFLRALDTGEEPMGECHDNIKSLAMCFAAVESAKLGKRIKVEW